MIELGKLNINQELTSDRFGQEVIRITAWFEDVPEKGEVFALFRRIY